jgi:prophage regulatory protein
MPQHSVLRFQSVKSETGLSRTTVHRRIHDGLFPRPVSLGAKAVGWPAAEIAALNAARIAGKSNEEVRALVQRLHADRKAAAQ